MALPYGTALQQGNYVLDAHCFNDFHGAVYLATHVPTGRPVLLRTLGAAKLTPADAAALASRLETPLKTLTSLGLSILPQGLDLIQDQGTMYLVLPTDLGQPLARLLAPTAPWPLAATRSLLQSLIDALQQIPSACWPYLRLSPDDIWLPATAPPTDSAGMTLVGLVPAPPEMPEAEGEGELCRQLAYLLYFLLTGERGEATQTPLAVHLHQRHPTLPPALITAVEQATVSRPSGMTLVAWQQGIVADNPWSLPPSQTAPAAPSPGDTQPLPSPAAAAIRWPMWIALVGLIGAGMGLGFGLTLRFQGTGPTAVRFNPKQSFPPLEDWAGDDPVAEFDAPYADPDWSRDVWIPPSAPSPRQRPPVEPVAPPAPAAVSEPDLLAPAGDRPPADPAWEIPEKSAPPALAPTPAPAVEVPPALSPPAPLVPEAAPAPLPSANPLPAAPAPPANNAAPAAGESSVINASPEDNGKA